MWSISMNRIRLLCTILVLMTLVAASYVHCSSTIIRSPTHTSSTTSSSESNHDSTIPHSSRNSSHTRVLYFIHPNCDQPLEDYATEESFVGFHVTDDLARLIQSDPARIQHDVSDIPETACVKQAQVRLGSSMIPREWPEAFPSIHGLAELEAFGFESIELDQYNFIVYAPTQFDAIETVLDDLFEAAKKKSPESELKTPAPSPVTIAGSRSKPKESHGDQVVVINDVAPQLTSGEASGRAAMTRFKYHPMRRTMNRFAVLEQSHSMQTHLRRLVHVTNSFCYPIAAPSSGSFGTCSVDVPQLGGSTCTFYCDAGLGPSTVNTCSDDGAWVTGPATCDRCLEGCYCAGSSNINTCGATCPSGSYCPAGSSGPTPCPAGTYTNTTGQNGCTTCPAGQYNSAHGQSGCTECPVGSYCTGGSAISSCAAGTYGAVGSLTAQESCTGCPAGSYCTGGSAISSCGAGAYSSRGASGCANCPAGQYNFGIDNTGCSSCLAGSYCTGGWAISSCGAGTYSIGGTSECTICSAGSYNSATGQSGCSACPAGSYCPGGSTVITCSAGSYSTGDSGSCTECPAGSYCVLGATGPSACPTGSYCPLNSGGPTPCAGGTYGASDSLQSQTSCTTCPAGSYCTGGTDVTTCPIGAYCTSGVSGPTSCPSGQYNFATGQSGCISCPAGWYASRGNSTDCDVECPDGSYCVNEERFPCLPGTYADSTGLTACKLCEAGKFSLVLGAVNSTTCVDCPQGTFGIYTGQPPTSCLSCPPGTSNNNTGSNLNSDCIPCDAGSFSSLYASVTCAPCPLGSYQSVAGQSTCTPCQSNKYSIVSGSNSESTCQHCRSGTTSPPGSSSQSACVTLICPDGFYGEDCSLPCPLGAYCRAGMHLCHPGTFSNLTQSIECQPCPSGHYSTVLNASDIASCLPCPTGTFNPLPGASSCQNCPFGFISNLTAANSIDKCMPCPDSNQQVCVGSKMLIDLAKLDPRGVVSLKRQQSKPSTTTSVAPNPSRGGSSLRELAFGSDSYVRYAESNHTPDPLASTIPSSAIIACTVLLIVVAAIPLLLYQHIPTAIARHLDRFSLGHHVKDGEPLLKQPTKWGAAISWAFVPIAILIALILSSVPNAVVTKALLPSSSQPNPSHGCIQVTLRAFGAPSSTSSTDLCHQVGTTTEVPLSLASGFSSKPTIRTHVTNDSCSIAIDCLDCTLLGVGAWSVVLPWSYQLIEYELWSTGASIGEATRIYGILSPTKSTPMLDQSGEIHFSLLNAFFVDQRQGEQADVPIGDLINNTATILPEQLYSSNTGFDASYQYYLTKQTQDSLSITADSYSQLSIIFNPSDIIYQTVVTSKTSEAQFLFSILASVVSLFSLFLILFKLTEWSMRRFKISLIDLVVTHTDQHHKLFSEKTPSCPSPAVIEMTDGIVNEFQSKHGLALKENVTGPGEQPIQTLEHPVQQPHHNAILVQDSASDELALEAENGAL